MALFHLHTDVIGRSQGHSVVAAAAYRAGVRLFDERTGEVHNYERRSGVDDTVILAPAGAEPWTLDREALWNGAEMAEVRRDAQLARSGVLALPRELAPTTNIRLGRELAERHFVSRGMVVDLCFHDLYGDNPHVHWMCALRELAGAGFAARKNRSWNDKRLLRELREGAAERINEYLRAANVPRDRWVDHRRLEVQLKSALVQGDYERATELCRLPTKHMGRAATAIVARGEASTRAEDLRLEGEAGAWRVHAMLEKVAEWREEVEERDRRLHAWDEVARRSAVERSARTEAVEANEGGRELLRKKLTELNPDWRAPEAPRVADLDEALGYAGVELARIEEEHRAEEARRRAEEKRQRRARLADVQSREGGRAAYEKKMDELEPGWRDRDEPSGEFVDAALTYAENALRWMAAEREAEEARRLAEEERRRGARLAKIVSEGGRDFYEQELGRLDPEWGGRGEGKPECVDAALTYAEDELRRIEAARRAEGERRRREAAQVREGRFRKVKRSKEAWKLFGKKLDEIAPGWRRTGKAPHEKIDAALTYTEGELSRRAESRRQAAMEQHEREVANRVERLEGRFGVQGGDVSFFIALDGRKPDWRVADARAGDVDGALEHAEESLDDGVSAIQHRVVLDAERGFSDASSTEWRQASEEFGGRTDADERARALLRLVTDRKRAREIVIGRPHTAAPVRQSVVGQVVEWVREQVQWLLRTLRLVEPMVDRVMVGLPKEELLFGERKVPAVGGEPWKPGERVGPLGSDAWTAARGRLDRGETAAGRVGYRPKDCAWALRRYLEPVIDGELRRQKASWAESSGAPRPTRESARAIVLKRHRSQIEELLLVESYRVSGEPAVAAGLEQHRDRVDQAAKAVMTNLPTEAPYYGEPRVPAVGDEPWEPDESMGRVARDTWAAVRERLDRGETAAGSVDCQPKDRQRALDVLLNPLIDGELRRQERSWRSARDASRCPTRESARAVVLKRHWARIEELVEVESCRVSGEPARAASLERHRGQVRRVAKAVMAGLPTEAPNYGEPEVPAVTDESWEAAHATPLEAAVYVEVSNRLDRGESATGRAMGYTHDDRERAEHRYLDALTDEALERQRTSPPQSREDIRAALRRAHRARLRGMLAAACGESGGDGGGGLGGGPGDASARPATGEPARARASVAARAEPGSPRGADTGEGRSGVPAREPGGAPQPGDERSSAPASSATDAAGGLRPRGDGSRATIRVRRGEPTEGRTANETGSPSAETKQGPAEIDKKGLGDGGQQR